MTAVNLMESNGLIKNDTAVTVFSNTDPAHFVLQEVGEMGELASGEGEEAVSEQELDELFMDNWLHSAMTVVGIISVFDGLLVPGSKVLDLGCGGGYMTAVLAAMVAPNGKVIAVDHVQHKLDAARKSLDDHYPELSPLVEFRLQDVFKHHEGAPFDGVYVGGGVQEVPQDWLQLVRPDACLIAATPEIEPTSGETQFMLRKFHVRKEGGVMPVNMMFVNYEELVEPKL